MERIEKINCSGIDYIIAGKFAIDNILGKLDNYEDYVSVIVNDKNIEKFKEYIIENNLSNIILIKANYKETDFRTINGLQTCINLKLLEEYSPRYFSNNKSVLEEKIKEILDSNE